jgi:Ca2+-dependent lipid-binding protein
LYVRVVSASNLPAADSNGLSDPYVVLQLQGSKVKSRVIDNTLNPTWDEVLELEGDFLISDILTIAVMDRDRARPGHRQRSDDYLGTSELRLRTLPLGVTVQRDIALAKCDKKGRLDNKAARGAGAILRLQFSIQQPGGTAWSDSPWTGPFSDSESVTTPEPVVAPAPKPERKSSALAVVERAVTVTTEVVEEEFHFSWGNYSSSYSTDFTGYSECSEKLSSLHSGEKKKHEHPLVGVIKRTVRVAHLLSGKVVGAHGLLTADSDGTDSYATVDLVGKSTSKKKLGKTEVVHDTSDPVWNFDFDLGTVKKGLAVEFVVWQTHKLSGDAQIGYARVDVKNIEVDRPDEIEVPLGEPPLFKGLPWKITGWGTLTVSFKLTLP